MTYSSNSLLRKTFVAVGAISLLGSAAPLAFAAPQNSAASAAKPYKIAQNEKRGSRSDRRGNHRSNRGHNGRQSRGHDNRRGHDYRRGHEPRRTPAYRSPTRYSGGYSPAPRHRGYNTRYRSNIGISFNLGSPGYSQYRWAPTAYSFYRPAYGRYNAYQRQTVCRRINIEGWHHGHRELVSVTECSNPWDGSYIVQGSERVIACRW